MNIFIADPAADCFSTLPAPKMIDKAANECRRRSCYNFFFFFFFCCVENSRDLARSRGNELLEEGEGGRGRGEAHPGRGEIKEWE